MYQKSTRLEEIKALFAQVPGVTVGADVDVPGGLSSLHVEDVNLNVEGLTKILKKKKWTNVQFYQIMEPAPKYPGQPAEFVIIDLLAS